MRPEPAQMPPRVYQMDRPSLGAMRTSYAAQMPLMPEPGLAEAGAQPPGEIHHDRPIVAGFARRGHGGSDAADGALDGLDLVKPGVEGRVGQVQDLGG